MIIAIDYDFTYTEETEMWREFILRAQLRDITVICVTSRSDPPHNFEIRLPDGVKVICTDGKPKRQYALDLGYKVDIWIDDMPETIGTNICLNCFN